MASGIKSIGVLLAAVAILSVGHGLHGSLVGVRARAEDFDAATTGLIMSGYFAGLLVSSSVTPRIVQSVGHIRVFAAFASVASGSIGFASYLHYLAPTLPAWGERAVAGVFPLLLVALLYRRIGTIGKMSVVLVGGVLIGCLWIVLSGIPHLSAARLFDFPPAAFRLNWVFWAGLGHATLYALYDYFGYYNVCYLGSEVRDPARTIAVYVMRRATRRHGGPGLSARSFAQAVLHGKSG